jgi:hypothetical protein
LRRRYDIVERGLFMRRPFVISLVVALATALAAAATGSAATAPGISKGDPDAVIGEWAPGTVLVKFRPSVGKAQAHRALAERGVRSVQRIAFGIDVVKLPGGLSVARAVRLLNADPRVAIAEPDYYRYVDVPPNDTFAQHLWPLENTAQGHFYSGGGTNPGNPNNFVTGSNDADMDVTQAWRVETGFTRRPIIAVVDSGVDITHPDLDGRLWRNVGEVGGTPGEDDDGNGKVDDVNGWNFAGAGPGNNILLPPRRAGDGRRHGTHVAGIIAAERNNNIGVAGVCPGCRIMALRFMANNGDQRISDEIQAINYAKAEGARIINASFGGPNWSNLEREAIRKSGALFVAAAGNESLDNDMALSSGGDPVSPSYPAAYDLPNVLTVAATNHRDEYGYSTRCFRRGNPKAFCAFTNWGRDSVDVAAPGVDILSTVPVGTGDVGSNYEEFDGTSMAAPNVAGVAGLVKSAHRSYTTAQLKNAIMRSVNRPAGLDRMPTTLFLPNTSLRQGIFTRTNDGRVNAKRALTVTPTAFPKTDGNIGGARAIARSKSGAVAWPSDDNDVFKRRLTRGNRYRVRLDGPGNKDFDLYVYRPGTKEIWQPGRLQRRSIGFTADETVTFRAGATGIYYFQVSAWIANAGGYRLIITRL